MRSFFGFATLSFVLSLAAASCGSKTGAATATTSGTTGGGGDGGATTGGPAGGSGAPSPVTASSSGGAGGAGGATTAGSTGSSGTGAGGATTGGPSGGSGAPDPQAYIPVDPPSPTVLTCAQQAFTAENTPGVACSSGGNSAYAWSASLGTIDGNGVFTAPTQLPVPPGAPELVVTATCLTDGSTGAANVTLATAAIGASGVVSAETVPATFIYQHAYAARGDRIYAAMPQAKPALKVHRSDDQGALWQYPTDAAPGLDVTPTCAAIAIDAGNVDVVYVVYRAAATKLYNALGGSPAGTTHDAIVFAASTDGGMTFQQTPLLLGGFAGGPFGGHNQAGVCPDIVSPAKGTVVVTSPGNYASDGNPDIFVFADKNQGAGFGAGTAANYDYQADGETGALATSARALSLQVGQFGGSASLGESPRLFSDGNGRLCVTWVGYHVGSKDDGVYVQCSTDAGATFNAPVAVTTAASSSPHAATGAARPDGSLLVTWWAEADPTGSLLYATSTDGGKTFGLPKAVPVYDVHPPKGFINVRE